MTTEHTSKCGICSKEIPFKSISRHKKMEIYSAREMGFKFSEIAELMDLSIHTCRSYYKAHEHLQRRLIKAQIRSRRRNE